MAQAVLLHREMQSAKSILVADDLYADQDSKIRAEALSAFASEFSRRLEEKIELVHVEDLTAGMEGHDFDGSWDENILASQQKCLEERVKFFPENTHASLLTGRPVDTFEKLSRDQEKYQCLVVASHGYRGMRRLLLGSFADEMIRRSHIPVIVLGHKAQTKSWHVPEARRMKVLLASDLGENSKSAEDFVLELSKYTPIQLHVYHCLAEAFPIVYQNGISAQVDYFGVQSTFKNMKSAMRDLLEKKQKFFQKNQIQTQTFLDEQSYTASEGALRSIEQYQPDLIVMGTHGRNLLTGAFLGNTARGLVLESPVPVAIVNSKIGKE